MFSDLFRRLGFCNKESLPFIMVDTYSKSTSLREYLKKYTTDNDEEKKKRKKFKAGKPAAEGILRVDKDLIWQKPVKLEREEYSSDEKKPEVDGEIEVVMLQDQNSDISPPCKRRALTDTPSPIPEQEPVSATGADLSPPWQKQKDSPLLIDRPKTGLISCVDIKEEIDRRKKLDELRFKEMDPSVSGLYAEPVYRSKITGEHISKEEFLETQKKKQKKEVKPKEIKLEWGKGLAQKREAEARLEELEIDKDKPFARSRDDPDLDRMLKERVRWGDPMAQWLKQKHLVPVLPDLGDSEKMKESGFTIPQEIPSCSWIRTGHVAAPNRYGIKPGRHWDGVDRTNGYEKELLDRTNEERASQREGFMCSVSEI